MDSLFAVTPLWVTALSFGCAIVLGFAGHRASLCGVAAVAEIVDARRAHMLASFGKAILWALLISLLLGLLMPAGGAAPKRWPLSASALLGGAAFGIGAAFNNGCSVSTLTRLADGKAGYLFTFLGLATGLLLHSFLYRLGAVPALMMPRDGIFLSGPVAMVGLVLLALFAAREFIQLWLGRASKTLARHPVQVRHWTLALAALAIGTTNAFLNHFEGTWSYTTEIGALLSPGARDFMAESFRPSLFIGVLAGMVASSLQSRKFHFALPGGREISNHFLGGTMMGLGVALIPGGNDALLFEYIPGLSPHALPAYAGMIGGIYVVLKMRKRRVRDRLQRAS